MMLGTRVILLGMNALPDADQGDTGAEMLCAANHEIPLFWLLPFVESDLQQFTDESAEAENYPLLIAGRTALLSCLQNRIDSLLPELNPDDAGLLKRWQAFLSEQDYPVLAIDTYELWRNRADPGTLEQELAQRLQQLQRIATNPAACLQALQADGVWSSGNPIALAGFGW
ncbi:hypothetical protein [Neptuniibacter halophilus]|uniref:hypothetical protein n=1 Tax=Neptuniibacter halophilus TaxID=651666 RepID=UPI002572AF39|nr:hypothetical protein [Neptuniibacter halophilus]